MRQRSEDAVGQTLEHVPVQSKDLQVGQVGEESGIESGDPVVVEAEDGQAGQAGECSRAERRRSQLIFRQVEHKQLGQAAEESRCQDGQAVGADVEFGQVLGAGRQEAGRQRGQLIAGQVDEAKRFKSGQTVVVHAHQSVPLHVQLFQSSPVGQRLGGQSDHSVVGHVQHFERFQTSNGIFGPQ